MNHPFCCYLLLAFGLGAFTTVPAFSQHNADTTKRWGKDTVVLKEVIIKATRRIYSEQQIDWTIIHVNALPSNAGLQVVEILNNTPGIMVDDNGNISIRGKDQAVIFIDDKPVYLTGKEMLNYLQSLPTGTLDRIEIMPNPPARYAAAGAGGIILIRTKKSNNNGFNGSLAFNYAQGIYPKSNNSFACNYRKGNMNLYGVASYNLSQGNNHVLRSRVYHFFNSVGDYSIYQDNAEVNQRDAYGLKLGMDIGLDTTTNLSFSVKSYISPYRESGQYANSFYSKQPDSVVYSNGHFQAHTTHHLLNLGILHRFSKPAKEWSLNMDYLTMNDQSNQVLNSNTLVNNGIWQNNNMLISSNPFLVHIYSVSADLKTPLAASIILEAGLQSIFSSRESNSNYMTLDTTGLHTENNLNNHFHFNENINAVYGNLRGQYKQLAWQAGLRVENTNVNTYALHIHYTGIFPTLFLQYKPDSGSQHTFHVSFGKRITRPDYQSYNPSIFFFNRYTYSTGNSMLEPQYDYGIELSYGYARLINIGLQFSKSRNSLITAYRQLNEAFVTTNVNVAHSSSMGVNITNQLSLTKWWTLNLYQELMLTRYAGNLFSNNELLDQQLTSYRATVNQQFALGKGWGADIAAIYRSNILYGQTIFKAVWQVHAGLQKQYGKHGSLGLSARDIFHSWVVKRHAQIPNTVFDASYQFDSRFIGITWNYRFGGSAPSREKKSALQTETGRVGINGG